MPGLAYMKGINSTLVAECNTSGLDNFHASHIPPGKLVVHGNQTPQLSIISAKNPHYRTYKSAQVLLKQNLEFLVRSHP